MRKTKEQKRLIERIRKEYKFQRLAGFSQYKELCDFLIEVYQEAQSTLDVAEIEIQFLKNDLEETKKKNRKQ